MPLFYTVPQRAGGFRRGNQARGLAPEPTPTHMGLPCLYGGRGFRPDFAPARIGPLLPFPHFSYLKTLPRRAWGPACRADVGSWRGFAQQHGVAPETLPPTGWNGPASFPHQAAWSPAARIFRDRQPIPKRLFPSASAPGRPRPQRDAPLPRTRFPLTAGHANGLKSSAYVP